MAGQQTLPRPRRRSTPPVGRTALYRHYDADDRLLYVGISTDPFVRTRAHKSAEWADRAVRFTGEWFPTRAAALAAERKAIRKENPEFNRQRFGTPGGPTEPIPRSPGATISTTIRLDPHLVATVADRARRADVDFSHMVRRMLAYADRYMPEDWLPSNDIKTSPSTSGRG